MVVVAAFLASLSLGLSEPPYLGVACSGPQVTTCGRIGVAVWLTTRALGVDAEVSGARVRLHAGGLGGRGPAYWQGFVRVDRHQLGLPVYWYGTKPVKTLTLKLRIRYPMRVAVGSVRVRLHPGWG